MTQNVNQVADRTKLHHANSLTVGISEQDLGVQKTALDFESHEQVQ